MAANVRVRPAKLTDDEWLAMRADLEAVAVDLANDLVGKAKAGAAKAIRARTPLDDLAAARQLMVRLDRATSEIGQQPYTVLKSTTERAKRPPRRLDAVTLKKLLARGIDPRRCPTSMSGLVAERRPITSTDVREHREIVGTLRAASRTLVDGEWRARIEIGEIEADRPWRERPLDAPGTSLYERLDYPRVQRLRQFLGESTNLRKWAARIINLPVLYGLRPEMKPQATQVSRHCPPYRLAFRAILAWRLAGRVQIDVGNLIRRKDTDRMYEQWVFLQLVAGLQFIGFILERQEDVFRKISQRRYLVDLPRGAHLGFRGPSEARVDIYFEPWIRPKGSAKRLGDLFFHGISREVAWSPDILLTTQTPTERYTRAIVVDAKYTRTVMEHHWSRVRKYVQIRRLSDDGFPVSQVWIASPGVTGINFEDDSVQWSSSGPNLPSDANNLQGTIGLRPTAERGSNEPVPTTLEFLEGLLIHRGLLST